MGGAFLVFRSPKTPPPSDAGPPGSLPIFPTERGAFAKASGPRLLPPQFQRSNLLLSSRQDPPRSLFDQAQLSLRGAWRACLPHPTPPPPSWPQHLPPPSPSPRHRPFPGAPGTKSPEPGCSSGARHPFTCCRAASTIKSSGGRIGGGAPAIRHMEAKRGRRESERSPNGSEPGRARSHRIGGPGAPRAKGGGGGSRRSPGLACRQRHQEEATERQVRLKLGFRSLSSPAPLGALDAGDGPYTQKAAGHRGGKKRCRGWRRAASATPRGFSSEHVPPAAAGCGCCWLHDCPRRRLQAAPFSASPSAPWHCHSKAGSAAAAAAPAACSAGVSRSPHFLASPPPAAGSSSGSPLLSWHTMITIPAEQPLCLARSLALRADVCACARVCVCAFPCAWLLLAASPPPPLPPPLSPSPSLCWPHGQWEAAGFRSALARARQPPTTSPERKVGLSCRRC